VDLDLNGKKREKSKGERKSADPIGRESKKQELGLELWGRRRGWDIRSRGEASRWTTGDRLKPVSDGPK